MKTYLVKRNGIVIRECNTHEEANKSVDEYVEAEMAINGKLENDYSINISYC